MNLMKFIYNLNYKKIMKNYILLESNPDYSDNTWPVYEELISRHYNENYKIIWFVDNSKKFRDIKEKNVKFVTRNKKLLNLFIFVYYSLFAKYIIDSNKCIKKINKNQFRIYLTHGAPLKLPIEYCKSVGNFDYMIQISDYFTKINAKLYNVNRNKIISTGFPRNDIILNKEKGLIIYPNIKREKTIFWFPTYRNHKLIKNNQNFNLNISFPFGVPAINSINELKELNSSLKYYNVLLIVKLHPAEDSSKIEKFNFSNIKLINDSFLVKKHINIYQLLSHADGLITDYSSIYYDFLLTDKPIGLAIPDFNEYKKHFKLLFEDFNENIPGEYIYDFSDLLQFVINVKNNKDIAYLKKIEKKAIYHLHCDALSSKRVVDILDYYIKNGGNNE